MMIHLTILTAFILGSIAIADPGLLHEKTLAFAPPSHKEITIKQDNMKTTDANNAQQIETAHNSCQDVAKEKGFQVHRVLHTNQINDPTKGSVFQVFMDMSRQGRSYRAKCIYNPANEQAHISGLGIVVRK